jgi:hypothetical protein
VELACGALRSLPRGRISRPRCWHFLCRVREKLVRERGAGSGERGAGKKRAESRDFIFNFFEILTNMARLTYYRGYKCLDFFKILEVAPITVVEKNGYKKEKYESKPTTVDDDRQSSALKRK